MHVSTVNWVLIGMPGAGKSTVGVLLAKRPEQTFVDLYAEREALYERYADITVDAAVGTHEAVCEAIMTRLADCRPGA